MAQVTSMAMLTTGTFSQSPFIYDYERIQNISIAIKLFPKLEDSSKEAEQEYDVIVIDSTALLSTVIAVCLLEEVEEGRKIWYPTIDVRKRSRKMPIIGKMLQLWILILVFFTIFFNFVAT